MDDRHPDELLRLQQLRVSFPVGDRGRDRVDAINGLNLYLRRGETLGLVGESGCGKSLLSLAIMGLIPRPGRVSGEIWFRGEQQLIGADKKTLRRLRGNRIAMIFQDPMSALNPVYTLGSQLREPLRLHRGLDRGAADRRAAELLDEVGLPDAERQLDRYPHELSGGQRQRVMIAMALSCEPDLLIADEPTTALDVTIQAQILELIARLRDQYQTAVLLISHDLGVIRDRADRVAVMYAGNVVESAPAAQLFAAPCHPYTRGLLAAVPTLDDRVDDDHRLHQISGNVPALSDMPAGCRFQARCERARPVCADELPDTEDSGGHAWRCHFPYLD